MEQYTVTGMSCAACAARVEKAVLGVRGVNACSVSLLTNSMGVEGSAAAEEVIAAVAAAGYGAAVKRGGKDGAGQSPAAEDMLKDRETPLLKKRLFASLGFLLVLMYVSMGSMMWGLPLPPLFENNHAANGLLQLLLAAAVMVINQRFFVSGVKSLWHRAPNMDALVALGSAAAFCYSTFALFAMLDAQASGNGDAAAAYMHEFYFESAAMILALITLGKMLEARSKGKTTDALKGLIKLAPKTAAVIRDGIEIALPVDRVVKGDVFVVRPGENIPVDGIVLDGSSAVDESTLTGESIPVDKAKGNAVSAGTLNQSGFIRCEATRVGEGTTLAQIIRMVSDAAATKAPIAKVADKVSGIFVPAVIVIAAVTVLVWLLVGSTAGFALARGISVLVISCPCALGLATPVAIMVGNGIGAKNGILFKTAASLEKTGRAQIVALDKTGTITQGRPSVTDIISADGCGEQELLTVAYALENKSEHPLARAINEKAEERGLAVGETERFRALPGNGIAAYLDGALLLGGSYKFISEQIAVSDEMKATSDRLSEEGKTPLFFARGGALCGIIAVADMIKDDSPQAIKEMRRMGIRTVMLTGDNERTARAIGAKAGVDEVIAGVLPDGKESAIRELRQKGTVIMVGDGVNDAPALTSADIGVAIGAGADVAIDAADVVLVKSRLSDLTAAIRLSRATLRNIHENLFWAFIYNVVGIPLAAGVFIEMLGLQLSPMFAAAAMSLSSFSVVTNALRLNFFKVHDTSRGRKAKNRSNETVEKETNAMKKTLKIEGMMCGHCEMQAKAALEAIDGVKNVEVSCKTGTAVVESEKEISDDAFRQAIAARGYRVTEIR